MVVQAHNLCTWEADTKGWMLNSRMSWDEEETPDHLGLYSETMSNKQTKQNRNSLTHRLAHIYNPSMEVTKG